MKKLKRTLYAYNGFENDPDGYGRGGYRVNFYTVIAESLTQAKQILNEHLEGTSWEIKFERNKEELPKSFLKFNLEPGVYHYFKDDIRKRPTKINEKKY